MEKRPKNKMVFLQTPEITEDTEEEKEVKLRMRVPCDSVRGI
jgi:hypothetical protein